MSRGLGLFDCDNDEGTKAIERPSALASQVLDGALPMDPGNDVARQERIKVEGLPSYN